MPFSLRKLTKLQILAACLVIVSALTVLGINRKLSATKTNAATISKPVAAPSAMQAARKAVPLGKGYIDRNGAWPQLHSALDAYGDRLEKPGKERLIATGTISNADTTANEKVPVRLVFEFPDKLRIEKQKAGKMETTIFDGKTKIKLNDVLKQEEEKELESLVFDSVDHFMAAHLTRTPLRFLGDRFRLDDGTNPKYTGSYYDIYQITEPQFDANNVKKDTLQEKLYFFNSDNHKLERITYQVVDKKVKTDVVVELSGWQKLDGQVLPTTMTRFENGKQTITLTISALALSTRANDDTFSTIKK
jgi:outer membrane lipoprotein-sorting protein